MAELPVVERDQHLLLAGANDQIGFPDTEAFINKGSGFFGNSRAFRTGPHALASTDSTADHDCAGVLG